MHGIDISGSFMGEAWAGENVVALIPYNIHVTLSTCSVAFLDTLVPPSNDGEAMVSTSIST